jgi:opacity protein-like surface antigen
MVPTLLLLSSGLLAELAAQPVPPVPSAPAPARWADDGSSRDTYLRATGGLTTTEDSDGPNRDIDFEDGYLVSLGLGQRFGESDTGLGFALELDAVWTDQDTDTNPAIRDVTVIAGLINGLLDFRINDQFTLYGGAGIGPAWMDVGTESDAFNDFDDEDGPFLAWQAKAGVGWNLSSSTILHLGYRFLNIDDNEIDDDIGNAEFDLETQQHVLEAGLMFGI